MTAVVPLHPGNAYSAQQLALIRNTVAKDCNPAEFDLFVTVARNAGLDPFRRQISAIVFNKNKPDKRRMSIITGIDGLRAIAARSGRYRPDEEEPGFEFDQALKGPTNPLGMVKATVRIYIADTVRAGGWRPVMGVAYWDEFAPVSEEWKEGEDGKRRPTGKMALDTSGNWARMPRIMLAKCAEAQALRKAFPEDMSGLYEGAELDQARVIDVELSPSEQVAEHQAAERLTRIGAVGIMFQMFPNSPLESIPLGQIADKVAATVKSFSSVQQMRWFESANRHPLQEFWARSPGDALELKKIIEAERERLEQEAAQPEPAA